MENYSTIQGQCHCGGHHHVRLLITLLRPVVCVRNSCNESLVGICIPNQHRLGSQCADVGRIAPRVLEAAIADECFTAAESVDLVLPTLNPCTQSNLHDRHTFYLARSYRSYVPTQPCLHAKHSLLTETCLRHFPAIMTKSRKKKPKSRGSKFKGKAETIAAPTASPAYRLELNRVLSQLPKRDKLAVKEQFARFSVHADDEAVAKDVIAKCIAIGSRLQDPSLMAGALTALAQHVQARQEQSAVQAAPVTNIPSDNPRYAQVQGLLQDEPDVARYAAGLAEQLQQQHYVVIPNLLGAVSKQLKREVTAAFERGDLDNGKLGGGKAGTNTKYVLEKIRGDHVGWFNQDPCYDDSTGREHVSLSEEGKDGSVPSDHPRCWQGHGLKTFTRKMNTMVQLVSAFVPELHGIDTRSEAMVTCYPGNRARYIRHVDNPHGNGRKLTVLYYLNHDWRQGDGGELRVYRSSQHGEVDSDDDNDKIDGEKDKTEHYVDLPPTGDTMVMFFSDTRVPHEVLPTHKPRYAITHWFYDTAERELAEQRTGAGFAADLQVEEERLRNEIAKFERRTASSAQVLEQEQSTKINEPTKEGPCADERVDQAVKGSKLAEEGCAPSANTTVFIGNARQSAMTIASDGTSAGMHASKTSVNECAGLDVSCTLTATHVVYRCTDQHGMQVEVDVDNRMLTIITQDDNSTTVALHPAADVTTLTVKRIAKSHVLKIKCSRLDCP
eukprot:TRINITY_DN11359_c1_g1_i1.p1 TRINITY_DN11359_c1_g1~~TRINITY_DN11359_c1_g1_i1.p1  ORF type:complete len:725 (+),score=117.91 TRINITY_DN11359_c1_g1_i1:1797-3971(+)